jgi:hypothetical protein
METQHENATRSAAEEGGRREMKKDDCQLKVLRLGR